VTCRKRIDKATPLLLKALVLQQPAEMVARFYRPNPNGDGPTDQYYTISGTAGRVVSVKQLSPDAYSASSQSYPLFEEVTFEFASVTFTYINAGASATWPTVP
jgi:type VI secretion system secreted protein Hcp